MRGANVRTCLAAAVALLALSALVSRVRMQPAIPAQALGLPQGWNLIADPGGIVASVPAYTYQAGDTSYETVQPGTPLIAGLGYWVRSSSASALPLGAGSPSASLLAPAGQLVMVGNPSGLLPAVVTGADLLLTYSPASGYQPARDDTLLPGQGAFARSLAGRQITVQAQGSATAACSTAETGSACPVSGACPQDYPVAITDDAFAHPQPGPGALPVSGTIVLCFNALSQARAAGYPLAPATQITLTGPVSATTSGIRFTVLSATLESTASFLARIAAAGEQLCSGCDVAGATAVVAVEYGVENLDRPPTLISPGSFVSVHSPPESSPAYFLLASQHAVDPVHNGVPVSGAVSGVFVQTDFANIDSVDWRLDNPLTDSSSGIPQPHGPSLLFELDFRGPLAGQILPYGSGSAPLPPYDPNHSALGAPPAAAALTPPPPPTGTPAAGTMGLAPGAGPAGGTVSPATGAASATATAAAATAAPAEEGSATPGTSPPATATSGGISASKAAAT